MSLDSIRARNAADKRAGVKRTYPQHAGKKSGVKSPIAARAALPTIAPCAHLGARLAGQPCGSPLLRCGRHGDITARFSSCSGADRCCRGCPDYVAAPKTANGATGTVAARAESAPVAPSVVASLAPRVTQVDPAKLAHAADNRKFNCSVLSHEGRRLMAYRVGWTSSRIHIAELDAGTHQPTSTKPIELRHPRCAGGQEDPRLFSLAGVPHLAFAGLQWERGKLIVSQMLARLSPTLTAERIWEPRYTGRAYPMEKNWQFFETADDSRAYAVYTIRPHKVLVLDIPAGTAEMIHETDEIPHDIWPGWALRGGAAPVRVGDEFYCFFHGWRKTPTDKGGGWYDYATGVYTFSAKRPFTPLRITREPVWVGDASKRHLNVTPNKCVLYPSGAIREGEKWIVSAGSQDSECLIGEFAASDIEAQLEPLA